jgi:hypothetical protein
MMRVFERGWKRLGIGDGRDWRWKRLEMGDWIYRRGAKVAKGRGGFGGNRNAEDAEAAAERDAEGDD